MNEEIKIIDTTYYSVGFPNIDGLILERENYIYDIINYFNDGIDIVFLSGDPDTGKTTLLAQFNKLKYKNTISIFFNPNNTIDYQVEYFFENFISQGRFILQKEQQEDIHLNETNYISTLNNLRRYAKQNKTPIYVLVDGLEDSTKTNINSEFTTKILSLLPFGYENFKVLLSGKKEEFIKLRPLIEKNKHLEITLTGLSKPEIKTLLSDLQIPDIYFEDIFKITRGFPGRLATLKRIRTGNDQITLEDLFNSTQYRDWIEFDCNQINLQNQNILKITSILTFARKIFSIQDYSEILSIPVDDIYKIFTNLKIVTINDNKASLVSSGHKRFLETQLGYNKNATYDLIIQYYSRQSNIIQFIELPEILAETKEFKKIFDILNSNEVTSIIKQTGSIEKIKDNFAIGLNIAISKNEHTTALKFSYQNSIINEINNHSFYDSELEARTAINDINGAISMANSAVLKIDKLRLLIKIAKYIKEHDLPSNDELIEIIQSLYTQVELQSAENKLHDIISDLIYILPSIAIDIIDKTKTSEDSFNNWILTKLALSAIESNKKFDNEHENLKLEAINKTNNPNANKIYKSVSVFVGSYNGSKILQEIENLTQSEEKLILLKIWLENNEKTDIELYKLLVIALDLIIENSSKITVSNDTFLIVSHNLKYLENKNEYETIKNKLVNIDRDFTLNGELVNFFNYKINLISNKLFNDFDDIIGMVNNLKPHLNNISDKGIFLDCSTTIYSFLYNLPNKNHKIASLIKSYELEITNSFNEIFADCANHYLITKKPFQNLSKSNYLLAYQLVESINTSYRRDRALLNIFNFHIEKHIENIDYKFLTNIESKLSEVKNKQTSHEILLSRLMDKTIIDQAELNHLNKYFTAVELMKNSAQKSILLVYIYQIIKKNKNSSALLITSYENKILESIDKIDSAWDKIDLSFQVCALIGPTNLQFAEVLFNKAINIKNGTWLDSSHFAFTYLNSLKLLTKAYSNLIILGVETEKEFDQLDYLIKEIPSKLEQLLFYTELGFIFELNDKTNKCKELVNYKIIPLLNEVKSNKLDIYSILDTFTLIYITNQDIGTEIISTVFIDYKETIFRNICNYYITNLSPFEPYDRNPIKFKTDYTRLKSAIKILKLITTDAIIYEITRMFSKSVYDNKNTIHSTQQKELFDELEKLIKIKLPQPKNIKHEGYLLLSLAYLYKTNKQNKHVDYVTFIQNVCKIPNISDRIFVLSNILDILPFDKFNNTNYNKGKVLNDVLSLLEQLPTKLEFVQRIIDITDLIQNIDPEKCKLTLSNAFNTSVRFLQPNETLSSQKEIIDLAYKIDPDFAKSLMKLSDTENKEFKYKQQLKEHFEAIEITHKIKNSESIEIKEKRTAMQISNGALECYTSLNSGKINPKPTSEIERYFKISHKNELQVTFPIFILYLLNCIKKYNTKSNPESIEIHRGNFNKLANSINLVQILSIKAKTNFNIFNKAEKDDIVENTHLINLKSETETIAFLRNWINENAKNNLIIVDPYFSYAELKYIKMFQENRQIKFIKILTSKNNKLRNVNELNSTFKAEWRKISDETPPTTLIIMCWNKDNNESSPFHDRYILSNDHGLRLGSSLNAIGGLRDSEISIMTSKECKNIKTGIINEYISMEKHESKGVKIEYLSFTL